MPALNVLIPDVEVLLGLPPESLAGAILQDLNDALEPEIEQRARSNPSNYTTRLFIAPNECYPREHQEGVFRAILEAWAWLEREGLLIERHNFGGAREYFVTRRGEQLADEEAFAAYRQASQLPRELLHPAIADDCWINFISGRYDTAVFEAFRAVEIAVRAAGGFVDTNLGVDLMRRAFRPEGGPLTRISPWSVLGGSCNGPARFGRGRFLRVAQR